jgi:hypothetical protein
MGTAIIASLPIDARFVRFCDFCGASETEAEFLISSPNGNHICDRCVSVCVEVIEDRKAKDG